MLYNLQSSYESMRKTKRLAQKRRAKWVRKKNKERKEKKPVKKFVTPFTVHVQKGQY